VYLDGNDRIVNGTMGTMGTNIGNCTMFAWVRFTNASAVMYIWGVLNDGSTLIHDFAVNQGSGGSFGAGQLGVNFRNSANQSLIAATVATEITNGQWNSVAYVSRSASTSITFYVNGTERTMGYGSRTALTNYPAYQYPPTIGARNVRGSLSGYFTGTIGEFLMVCRPLESNDVWQLHHQSAWRYGQ
jgi:hypothetical protein